MRKNYRFTTGSIALSLVASLWLFAEVGTAREKRKADAKGKNAAPTQEDHADYFSTDRADVSDADKKKADDIRLKTITSIGALLKSNIKSDQKFELLLRLGDLYAERHDYIRDLEMKEYDASYTKWVKAGKKGVDPKLNDKVSKGELVKSANAFRKLVQEFPKHPRSDAALYSLAKTLGRLGNDNAELYFNQLLKSHPKSPLIPEAYLALGEFYFDKEKIPQAMAAYKSAMKYKESRVYPYAVYKLGWTYYNTKANSAEEIRKNTDKALAAFKLVVVLSTEKQKGQPSAKMNLRQEAINDLVMVWAETERVDEAWDYFKKIDEQVAFYDLLERLGNIYVENGEDEKAIRVYTRLLKDSPDRESNPAIHAKLVEIYERTGKVPAVVTTLKEMSQQYVFESSWLKKNATNADTVAEAKERTERNIHRYGAIYHNRGSKTNNQNLLRAAAEIYKLYLRSFPNNPNAYELRYYLADIYFIFKQWENSSDEYLKVATDNPRGKYLKDAALNAVVALNKADQEIKYQPLPAAGQVAKPIPLPRVKKKMVNAMDTYVKLLPQETQGQPMRFTAAQIHFDYGYYDEAIKRFEAILMELPKTKQGEASLKVIMAYYNEKKDWDQVIERSRRYRDAKDLASLRPIIEGNLKNAMFQKGLKLEKEKKYAESASVFLSFQSEFPSDKNAPAALYNATLNFYRVADIEAAIDASRKILAAYPNAPIVNEVMVDLAQTYEALAEFENAAGAYAAFAGKFPTEKRAPGALYNAATLYKGLNQYDRSIDAYRRYVKAYPKEALVPQAELAVAEMQEKKKDYKSAAAAFQQFAAGGHGSADDKAQAWAKAIEINVLHLNKQDGLRELPKLRTFLTRKDAPPAHDARRIVASLLFNGIEPDFQKYRARAFNNGSTIQKDVELKQKELVSLAKRYEGVIEMGSGEFSVASLYRLGEMHENFSVALFKAPAPSGANQAEVDQFKSQIEKLAFPLKEESVKFYEGAFARSKEVETFTDWTATAYKKMVELDPAKYPEVGEQNLAPGYIVHDLKIDNSVASLVN